MNLDGVQAAVVGIEDVDGLIDPVVWIADHCYGGLPALAGEPGRYFFSIYFLPLPYFYKLAAGSPLTIAGNESHIKWLAAVSLFQYFTAENDIFHALKLHRRKGEKKDKNREKQKPLLRGLHSFFCILQWFRTVGFQPVKKLQ